MRARGPVLAALAVALLAAGGCGSKATGTTAPPAGIRLYGTDGNMSNSVGAGFKTQGAIEGMVGTAPLTQLSTDFKQRVLAVDPNLGDFNYAGESYDAVVISALAVQIARTTDPLTVAKYINGVTTGGVDCITIKDCLNDIADGKDIAYRGIAVKDGFTDAGEPAVASYGTLHFGRNNKIDDGKTEFVSAGSDGNATKQAGPAPAALGTKFRGDPLKLGLLLPKSGALAAQGPPMFAGAHLAVRELNAAGGILGQPVESVDGDDGTDPDKASAQFQQFAADNIPITIGPATSGESAALIPKAVAAGKILFSPSATSASLSTADDHGLFFRACPPDSYQAQALTDVIMRGGARRVFIVARDDSYGTGLRDAVVKDLATAGIGGNDIGSVLYKVDAKDYGNVTKAVKSFKPDSVLVAGFEESAGVIQAMQAAGITFATL